MNKDTILLIGASGQIGTDLTMSLRTIYGASHVVASDIKSASREVMESGPFEQLDIMDPVRLNEIVFKYKVTQVYLLAALLSATAEKNIELGWALNMRSLSHVLDLARHGKVKKVYWPSSIAVFGPTTPSINTPQHTIMDPNTVYGISKQAGERWCEYYYQKFGVDVRSIRYPGLIGWKAKPGGGTTDYAVHIFHEAIKYGRYESFLSETTSLPMMYMPDAIRATLELMEAPADSIKIRSSYNVAGTSFNPAEIAAVVKQYIPHFEITYKTDERQAIANSWPRSINDSLAREHWNWKHEYDIGNMAEDMMLNLKKKYK
ncbi:NAD-dependent epimerase/dehydratase family protein [Flavobacteriales bacterium]|nr:NAD-dependent epimerase/dehydratase family protein [Flavobacteriales bacterium]MDG1146604.1 NAD-dependent epimerase/dehydratase family protein [Flavobacteriales bacterium]MDG1396355.1 NAD-dependent epimerase/dehydratase family protein [Flavobacteriales bacterium]